MVGCGEREGGWGEGDGGSEGDGGDVMRVGWGWECEWGGGEDDGGVWVMVGVVRERVGGVRVMVGWG